MKQQQSLSRRTRRTLLEALERRQLFTFSVASPIADVLVTPGSTAPASVSLTGRYTDSGTLAKFHFSTNDSTSTGDVYVELTDSATPLTVANFLNYVNSHRYDGTMVHRLIPGFVMQGGGYTGPDFNSLTHVTTDAPVVNEFTAAQAAAAGGKVNVRGTIAMAKTSDPNSATSEWFFNLVDNSSSLDNTSNSGGFTTFGTVVAGMSLVDYIAANVPTYNGGGAFANIPLVNFVNDHTPTTADFLNLQSVSVAAGYTYSVSSSNPSFVTASVAGSALSLNYGAAFGTSTITVTATDPAGRTVSDSFDIIAPEITVAVGGSAVTDNQSTPVSLGTPTQGATASKTFRVTNNGNSALSFTAPTVPAGFTITSPADLSAVSLNPGDFVDVTVSSVATNTGGAKAGTLTLNSNDPATPAFDVPLTYTVLTRQVSVASGSTTLSNNQSVNLGTSSAASFTTTLTVKNTGTGTLALSAPTLPAGYSVVQALPSTLAAGASANLVLAVDTSTTGTKAGNVVINSDDPNTAAFTIPVTATVTHAVASVVIVNSDNTTTPVISNQSTAIDFGAANQNQNPSNSKTFRITNTGDQTLTFGNILEPAGFLVATALYGSTTIGRNFRNSPSTPPVLPSLAPGEFVDITVTQRVDTGGDKSGTLTLQTNDPNGTQFGIPLTGLTHYHQLAVSYNSTNLSAPAPTHITNTVGLGAGTQNGTYTVTFHVTNTGDTEDLSVTAPTLPAGFFLVTSFASPLVLSPGQSADILIGVDTTAAGAHNGTITFNSNDPVYGTPFSSPGYHVPVTAYVNNRHLAVTDAANSAVSSGASHDFGTILQGDTATVTYHLTNTGNLPLTLSNPTLPAGFSLASTFPTTLAAGASADVVLSLNSLGRGSYSGAFTFQTNDTSSANPTTTFSLNLAGHVLAKGLVVSLDGVTIPYGQASTVDFGIVRQGTAGQQVTFTLANTGLTPLDFQSVSVLNSDGLPAGYTVVGSVPATLAAGASAQITIALDTSAPGFYDGTLHIVSSDPDRPSFDIPVSAAVTLPVKLGAGGVPSVTFTDADGTQSTITLTGPGSATLDFLGNNLVANTSAKKGTTLTGSSVSLADIVLSGTSAAKSVLTITSKGGNKSLDLGAVSGSPLLTLNAPAAKLTGNLTLTTKTLTLGSASNATITLGAGATVSIPTVTNSTLTTAGNIKSLTVTNWTGGSISAQSIDNLAVNGNLNASLTVKKPLAKATIKGNVTGGTWTLGGISKLAVNGSILTGWVANVSGTASGFTVAKNFSGSLTAKVLSLAINGSVTNATLTAKTTLTSLTVKGSYANTNLTAKSIAKATLGTIKTHNSGVPFTLQALSIASLSAKLDTGKSLVLSGVNSTPKLTPQLTKAGNLNDLKIRIA